MSQNRVPDIRGLEPEGTLAKCSLRGHSAVCRHWICDSVHRQQSVVTGSVAAWTDSSLSSLDLWQCGQTAKEEALLKWQFLLCFVFHRKPVQLKERKGRVVWSHLAAYPSDMFLLLMLFCIKVLVRYTSLTHVYKLSQDLYRAHACSTDRGCRRFGYTGHSAPP